MTQFFSILRDIATLSNDQVRHIAKLARLRLADADVEKFATELTSILGYVDMLREVDTQGVAATAQVTGQTNALRPDEIRDAGATPEGLLSCSPLPLMSDQIETPSAHG